MNYQDAIEALRLDGGLTISGKNERVTEFFEAIIVAISALQELQELHDQGLSLDRLKDIDFRKSVVGHINYDAYMSMKEDLKEYKQLGALEEVRKSIQELKMYKDGKLCLIPEDVYGKQCEELDRYKELGTLEEVREAVEKQKAKTPTYDGDGYAPDGTFVWDEWLCPHCGTRYEVDYDDHDYCPNCGQAINWSEEE